MTEIYVLFCSLPLFFFMLLLCPFERKVNEEDLKEFGTLSGYLCSQAGEIPAVGDYVMVGGYIFTVTKVGTVKVQS